MELHLASNRQEWCRVQCHGARMVFTPCSIQCLHANIVRAIRRPTRHGVSGLKVGTGARALDDFLDHLFDGVPVVVGEFDHVDAEEVRNLLDELVASGAADKADGYTDASKAAGTTDTMKVSLGVGMAVIVIWKVLSSGQWDNFMSRSIRLT